MGALRWAVLSGVAAAGAAVVRRQVATADLSGRVVLIAGGSRGLGVALAREASSQGASVVVAARDAEQLDEVVQELQAAGGDAMAVPADLTDPEQAQAVVDQVLERHARLDVLVNVAGVIQVAPLGTLTLDDFREAVDVMLWGPVALTLAALPALERSDAGRVATITSIGGKVPVPRLLPYVVAKHAAVGFSETLRAELGPTGVRSVTVVPGLMRTGSHLHARIKGPTEAQYRWFGALSQLPGVSMPADQAARRILAGIVRGDAQVSTTWWAPLATRVHGLAPGLTARAASLLTPVLPDDDEPGPAVPGHEAEAGLGPLEGRAQRNVDKFRERPERSG